MDKKTKYRQGVQVYLIKNDKLLVIVDPLQFTKVPSGGCEEGESPQETARREMKEELGVDIRILKHCEFKNKYDWPEKVRQLWNHEFVGQ